MKTLWTMAWAITLGSVSLTAIADENPLYKSWARHNIGTSITTKTVSESMGQKTEMAIVMTLLEKSEERVVVETKMSMTVAGNTMDLPAQSMDIPATAPEVPAADEDNPDVPKPEIKESSETIKIAGKEYKAKLTESTTVIGGMKVRSKSWTSDEVPGMMLKTETIVEGEGASESTMELTKITLK
jgi:hypothetical protein